MKQLRVMLVVKDVPASYAVEDKLSGLFSYPVPEFRWTHVTLGRDFDCNTTRYADRFDLVFHLDGSNWGRYRGTLPVVYWTIDSTLSEDHYQARRQQATEADLVLVDQDDLGRFSSILIDEGTIGNYTPRRGPLLWRSGGRPPAPVVRFPYCVNDHLFKLRSKTVDLGWHAHTSGLGGQERRAAWAVISQHALARGYTVDARSVNEPHSYAKALGSARVILSWPRVIGNRPHRILDAAMCGAAVLSGPRPDLDGFTNGISIVDAKDAKSACERLDWLLSPVEHGALLTNADAIGTCARALAAQKHTWAVRAQELHALMVQYFPERFSDAA